MPATVSRTAVLINLAAFIGFCVFCIATQAPLLQQDIFRRCRETLFAHHLPSEGVSVDGLDVTLSGNLESAATSAATQVLIANVPGVHAVHVAVADAEADRGLPGDLEPAGTPQQRELQEKVDRVLQNQTIAFKTDTPVLTPEGQAPLKEIAELLATAPNLRCEIRGYDDQSNEARQDWGVALQRALAVEDYLVSQGVAEWRLSARVFRDSSDPGRRHAAKPVDLILRAR